MAEWITVIPVNELQPGMHREVKLNQANLLLVNVAGEFYAVENRCSHDDGVLNNGTIEGSEIVCPRHGARFDLKTGSVLSAPAFEDIASYPVRVVDDMVQILDEPAET